MKLILIKCVRKARALLSNSYGRPWHFDEGWVSMIEANNGEKTFNVIGRAMREQKTFCALYF